MSAAGAGSGGSVKALHLATFRIFGLDREPVGAGFLITDRLALTCAHVVSAALGLSEREKPPESSRLEMDLPLTPGTPRVAATVVRVSEAVDVAVLRLDVPVRGARPVRLLETEGPDVWNHPVRAFGFPVGRSDGVWHSGILRGPQASGWIEADLAGATGYRVAAGFSGTPMWDDTLCGVVGMTVAAEPPDRPAVSYLIPTDRLLGAWPDLRTHLQAQVPPASPFRALTAFRETDEPVFFGRKGDSDRITAKVAEGGIWTTLVGSSGCGKSSLVLAGVVPRMRARGYLPVVMRPSEGRNPLEALADAFLPLLEPDLSEVERLKRLRMLTGELAEPGTLANIARRVSAKRGGAGLLIVIDQFEELFARPPADVDALANVLYGENVPDSVRVLATLRADFLENVLTNRRLENASKGQVELLQPMGPGQLQESVVRPVETVLGADGKPLVNYQPGLAKRILDDLGADPGALPLLEFTLDKLWETQHGGELTHEAYDALGGVRGALKTYIEQEQSQRVEAEGHDEASVRGLLTKLVHVPQGSVAATRRTALRTELSEDEWRIAQNLAASRLLVMGRTPEGKETVELAHEAVITAWGDLAAWVQADRAFLEWRESLNNDVARWEANKRHPDFLPGPAMIAGSKGREHELDKGQLDYIQRGRSRARRQRALIGVLSVLVLAVAGTGIVSVHELQSAAQRAAVVRSGTLAADAQALSASDPGLAAQIAVAAYRASPTQNAMNALYGSLQSPLLDNILAMTKGYVERSAAQADGPLSAVIDQSKAVHVWNLGNPARPILESTIHMAGVTGIALAPRAPLLAAACRSGPGLCLWSLSNAARPVIVSQLPTGKAHPPAHISGMAVSLNGTFLAAASESGYTLLWSIADPAHPTLLADLPSPAKTAGIALASVAFAPNGSLLAESIEHGATRLWSLADPAAPTQLAVINSGYQDIAINPAGTELAGASDTSLALWSIRSPAAPAPINYNDAVTSQDEDLQTLAFSPDGQNLAYSGSNVETGNSELCLLDLDSVAQDPADTDPNCISTGFSTFTMAYTSSGTLLTGGFDNAVRLWRASPAIIANANVYSPGAPAVSNNGHLMIATIADADAQASSDMGIWNLDAPAGPTLAATLPLTSTVTLAAFIDTNVVLTVTQNGEVQLWNISNLHDPRQTASLGTVNPTVGADGIGSTASNMVAVVGNQGVLNLWRVTSLGTATRVGQVTDPAAANSYGGILSNSTVFMTTPAGIDWWNISNPAKPVKTGTSPLSMANKGEGANSQGNASTLFTAASPPDPDFGGATLNLYSLDDGRVQSTATISHHSGTVIGLSNDGHLLADSGPAGNGLSIWNTTDPRAPKLASSIITAFNITGVTFSDDDDYMADWNLQTVQLWNIRNPSAPVLLGSFSPVVTNIDDTNVNELIVNAGFATDGKLLINTASSGPTLVYLIGTSPQQAADQLCSTVSSPITATQWRQYAPGVPYQGDPC